MKMKLFPILLFIIIWGCSSHRTEKLPPNISKLENLTVYNPKAEPPDTVELTRETVFQSSKDVFIAGYIGNLAIDDSDRIYIGTFAPKKAGVYVFKPDGSYITTIGRFGRGPGEFEYIGSLSIANSKLYVFDPRLKRINIFSLNDYSHLDDELINKRKLTKPDSLAKRLKGQKLFVTNNDGNQILELWSLARNRKDDIPVVLYYKLSGNGTLLPGSLLKTARFPFFFPANKKGFPFVTAFSRSSLTAVTKDGHFFTAWTKDFLIKEYDPNGMYLRAFYYPVKKNPLSLSNLNIDNDRQRVLSNYTMPKTWPALRNMEVDDQGRVWVETITDSTNSFKWWVLNPGAKLIARFTWPGDRSLEAVMVKPLIKIRHGYFYTHEYNPYKGIDRIVKYKIVLKHL